MCEITFAHICLCEIGFKVPPPPHAKICLIFVKNELMFQMIWQSVFCGLFDFKQAFHSWDGLISSICASGFKRSIQYSGTSRKAPGGWGFFLG